MRDKWFDRIGAMRLDLVERGFMATLYAWGDEFRMRVEEVREVFGEGWIVIAEELRRKGFVKLEIKDARVEMKINFIDEARRMRNRRKQAKRRERAAK